MSERFANPDYEPTDDELQQLAESAFADVEQKHRDALARIQRQIAQERASLRATLGIPR